VKLTNRGGGGADIKSILYVDMTLLSCAEDLITDSYVQFLYEIFAQRSGFQHGYLKNTIFGLPQSTWF
jgi:hypothetical protein